jgi:hypothetical protein
MWMVVSKARSVPVGKPSDAEGVPQLHPLGKLHGI